MTASLPRLVSIDGATYYLFERSVISDGGLEDAVRNVLIELGVSNPAGRLLGDALVRVSRCSSSDIRESYRLMRGGNAWIEARADYWNLVAPISNATDTLESRADMQRESDSVHSLSYLDVLTASLSRPNSRLATLPEVIAIYLLAQHEDRIQNALPKIEDVLEITSTSISDLALWGCTWAMDMAHDSYLHSSRCFTCFHTIRKKGKRDALRICYEKPVFPAPGANYGLLAVDACFRLSVDQFGLVQE